MFKLDFWKSDSIEFYTYPDLYGAIPEPRPAIKFLPDWFKHLPRTIDARDHFGARAMSAKQCMPLLDVMSTGFIIPLACDTSVMVSPDGKIIKQHNAPLTPTLEFHDPKQVGGATAPGYPTQPVKWLNKWFIKTAPGWSVLIIPPVNHFNEHFTCLGGVVETDKYTKEINFPAIWHTKNFDGVIPAGTPLVQVIPFKRKNMPKKAKTRKITDAEKEAADLLHRKQQSRARVYTDEMRGDGDV